jgi:hypothetical protein
MSRSISRTSPAHGTTDSILRASWRTITEAIAVIGCSPTEAEFFRAGDSPSSQPHDFSDLDIGHRPTTLWRVIVGWIRGERSQHAD